MLLQARSRTDSGDVVWFVLGREINQRRLAVRTGAHRVVMVGLRNRSVWHFTVFVATLATTAGTASTGTTSSATVPTAAGTGVNPLHLPGGIQNQLDTVRPLIVDTSPTNRFRKVVDHSPRHPGQIAQITVLTFRLNRHSAKTKTHHEMVNSNSLTKFLTYQPNKISLPNRVVIHAELH